VVDEVGLAAHLARGNDLEQSRLERDLDQASRQSSGIDVEEVACCSVGAKDPVVGIDEQRQDGRAFQDLAE
jgi:hypothetical protein